MLDTADARDPEARRTFYHAAGRFTVALAVETQAGLVYVPTNDAVIGERTFVDRTFEAATTDSALALLGELGALPNDLGGRDILEVGANIGTQTLVFARMRGVGRVIALEPAPLSARLLRAAVAANELAACVQVLPLAASDADSVVAMEANPENIGDWRIRSAGAGSDEMGEAEWRLVDVSARRLDGLAEDGTFDIERLALAWMDCQGHEGHILAGAAQLLASGVPIVTEFWPYGLRRAGGLERFAALVAASGRRVFDLRGAPDGGPAPVDANALLGLSEAYGPPRFSTVDAAFTDLVLVR